MLLFALTHHLSFYKLGKILSQTTITNTLSQRSAFIVTKIQISIPINIHVLNTSYREGAVLGIVECRNECQT